MFQAIHKQTTSLCAEFLSSLFILLLFHLPVEWSNCFNAGALVWFKYASRQALLKYVKDSWVYFVF